MQAPKMKVELLSKQAIVQIDKMTAKMFSEVRAIVNTTAIDIHRNAVDNVEAQHGVDRFGRLKTSIKVDFYDNGLAGKVGTEVAYAPFIEFGTGPRGQQTNKQELPDGWAYHTGNAKSPPREEIRDWCRRHGMDDNVAFVVARKIAKTGLPARPFLFPAWNAEKDAFFGKIKDMIKGGL